ncbi:tRNA (guanine(37)-N1)-methyltransferase [Smittium mucronatum]|uniref:tRNA (Guanine(37)-N1)-methyltransferase n=1 Tax=Smittium mucronatum TaxID=133383 RepID=A0A1R0H8T0_9FUNG|nr:tRNA (guanine(37)-N1)-methyltransferase [Smittium mucronatum]
MEVLAGENNLVATVRESNCIFKFDFSKVYWNSRLQNEHDRIVNTFKKGQFICDVMAGVGPFSIPAAKNKQCIVYANDLNPMSYSALVENIKLNKVGKLVIPFNIDGRRFVKSSFRNLVLKAPNPRSDSKYQLFDHVVMNLPATALEFLDSFVGVFHKSSLFSVPSEQSSDSESNKLHHNLKTIPSTTNQSTFLSEENYQDFIDFLKTSNMPLIHVHCFSKSEDATSDIINRAAHSLCLTDPTEILDLKESSSVTWVRKVAPNKDMYCLTFRLLKSVALMDPLNTQLSQHLNIIIL